MSNVYTYVCAACMSVYTLCMSVYTQLYLYLCMSSVYECVYLYIQVSRGESLLDWALKETVAANISREPSPHANANSVLGGSANSALGVQAGGGGFLQTLSKAVSREPSTHGNANSVLAGSANSALGVQAGGFLQTLSKADANSELTGAGIPPLLGRSRELSLHRACY